MGRNPVTKRCHSVDHGHRIGESPADRTRVGAGQADGVCHSTDRIEVIVNRDNSDILVAAAGI